MKKYFLIVLLFALMFLGLGNYSLAGAYEDCVAAEEAKANPVPENCDYLYQGTSSDDTTDNTTQTPCNPPKDNAHQGTLGCICNPGFKEVKGVCKDCNLPDVCCGVELNTNVPFIGKCLEDEQYAEHDPTVVSQERAFPVLMGSLTQILVTVILIVSFVLIVVGGIMIATGNPKGGEDLLMKVVIGIALLGASGVILRLINPNFFG